jgi:hypothetical protein
VGKWTTRLIWIVVVGFVLVVVLTMLTTYSLQME